MIYNSIRMLVDLPNVNKQMWIILCEILFTCRHWEVDNRHYRCRDSACAPAWGMETEELSASRTFMLFKFLL